MIYVDYINIDTISDNDYEYIKRWLPINFQKRVSGKLIDKKVSLLGRCLLYINLVKSNEGKMKELVFQLSSTRKLYVKNNPSFNISHAGSYVALAISDKNDNIYIGLDIEKYRSVSNINNILEYFSKEEKNALSNIKDVNNRFLKIWTKKEAFYKALGTGIYKNNSLKSVNCLEDTIKYDGQFWYFKEIPFDKGYACSCVTNKVTLIIPREQKIQELLASLSQNKSI